MRERGRICSRKRRRERRDICGEGGKERLRESESLFNKSNSLHGCPSFLPREGGEEVQEVLRVSHDEFDGWPIRFSVAVAIVAVT